MRSQVLNVTHGLPKPALKPSSRLKFRRSAKMELYGLILTGANTACGALILSPVLPFYAMQHGGATAFDFALITSAYSICQMISAPLLGTLSDRIGRRPVLLTGILASTALYFVMAEAQTARQLLVVRSFLGFASGTEPTGIAYMSDLTSKEELLDWVNLQMMIETFGALLGPAVGGYLAPYGFPYLCRVMGYICALNFAMGCIFFTEPRTLRFNTPTVDEPEAERSPWQACLVHFRHPSIGPLLLAGFLDSFALAISDGPEAYYLRDAFHFGEFDLGKFFMVCSGATLVVSKLVPLLRYCCINEKAACIAFSILSAVAMETMFMCQQRWIPYVYGAFISSTSTVVEVISKTALLRKMVHEQDQGAIYGVECALLRAGFSLGPPIGGLLYDWVHVAVPYALSAMCFLLSAAAYSSLPPAGVTAPSPISSPSGPAHKATARMLEHHSRASPLPGKRCAQQLTAPARRVFFVDPELYDRFIAEAGTPIDAGLRRGHSIGVESMTQVVARDVSADDVLARYVSMDA